MYSGNSNRYPSEPDPFLDLMYKAALVLLCVPIGPGILLGIALARLLKGRDEKYLALTVLLAITAVLALFYLLHPIIAINELLNEIIYQTHHSFQPMSLLRAFFPLWAMSLFLSPAVGLIWLLFSPRSVEERALERIRNDERKTSRAGLQALRQIRKQTPYGIDGHGILGVSMGGDLRWKYKKWFVYPTRELSQHGVIIGGSGSGKTETLLRIAVFAARVLGWQVIFVDGKGETATARRFVQAMSEAGISRIASFPDETYNGWVGDLDGLLNRLLAIEDFSESAYYRAVAENIVALALEAGKDLPRNSYDFLRRLGYGSLLNYYKEEIGAPEQTAYLESANKRDMAGVYNRYRATFSKLRGKLDGSWSYEDIDAAYVLLDGLALRELASGIGRYLVEDFAHYAGIRKPIERRVLFVFDELSAIEADVTNLFERVRSKNVSILVSGQSYSGLAYKGHQEKADRIISAATTLILHACSDPEELIKRAGKVKTSEAGYSFEDDERSTGRGTLRVREELRVSPDAVRQLGTGQTYVIAHGRAERVQIAQIAVSSQAFFKPLPVFPAPAVQDVYSEVTEPVSPVQEEQTPAAAADKDPDMID